MRQSVVPIGDSRGLDRFVESLTPLLRSVVETTTHPRAAYRGALRLLVTALDARDPYTSGHSARVSAISVAVGRALGLCAADLERLRLGALLHDIGKIGVPGEILSKPRSLTPSEFDLVKQHPLVGARIVEPVSFLAPHLPIVELHHERLDGRGYPHGLAADDIPLAARIVHVADAYDAMTSARAYRAARSPGEAIRELRRCAGSDFHADIVEALAAVLPQVGREPEHDARLLHLRPRSRPCLASHHAARSAHRATS
jgi:putative nucleotidyltransferase with HDIG domain